MFTIDNIPNTIRQAYVQENIPLMITNLLELYRNRTEQEHIIGIEWYKIAHAMAYNIGRYHDRSTSDIIGIISALSPGVQWSINVENAIRILNHGINATVSTYNPNKIKAVKIDNGYLPLEILGGNKVLSFYDNILYPVTSKAVTIDRHAVRSATLLPLPIAQRFINSDNKYNYVSQAYTIASETLDIKPLQLQAVTWLTYKRLYTDKQDNLINLPGYVFDDTSIFSSAEFYNAWDIVKSHNATIGI